MKTTTLLSLLLIFLIFKVDCDDQQQQYQQVQKFDQEQNPDEEEGQDEEQDQQEQQQFQIQQNEQDQDQEYGLEDVSDFEQQGWRKKLTKDNGAKATFYRDELKLMVQFGQERVAVDCMAFKHQKENEPYGPTPKKYYLIAKQRKNKQINNIYWYNLHMQMNDKSGFYGYCQSDFDKLIRGYRRSCLGIHPAGSVTHGCVACYQFDKVRRILNMGHVQYNKQQFCGWLHVV